MKHFTFALMVGAALLSAAGCASKDWVAQQRQRAAVHRHFQGYEAAHKQMSRFHEQARTQMLQTLSLAHQRLLARVVGQLTIARSPHVAEAANEIDTALTPKEKQAILSISAWLRNQWLTAQAQRRVMGSPRAFATNDPGMTLLLTVTTFTARQTSASAHAASSQHETKFSH